jgi:hypothetical protein
MVLIAQVSGLLALSVHPIGGVLVLLSTMALSLRMAAGICGASLERG